MESGWFGQVTLGSTSKLRKKKLEVLIILIKQATYKKDFLAEKNNLIIQNLQWFEW